jgi:hypothetical protein
MAAPATPTNFIAQQGNGQVYLSWDLSAGATSYGISRSIDGVTYASIGSSSTNSYLDTTVSLNTLYYYTITASNGQASQATSPQSVVPTMPGIESLASLRLQAQQTADRVNSNFVSTAEWNIFINIAAQELYDMLIGAYEDYNLAAPYTFVTDGINNGYALPDGVITDVNGIKTQPLYKLMGVDCGLANNNNARVTLNKFNFIDRNNYVYPNVTSTYFGVFNLRYRMLGSKLSFIPTPSAGQYITVHYIPRLPTLLKDTDVLDGVSGWARYVVVRAAIYALVKEESDVSALEQELMFMKQRIEEMAQNRDAGEPSTISNTRMYNRRNGANGSDGGY